jgi:hypothetical protein
MRKSKLTVDIQIYREKCNSVSNLLLKTKKQYLSDKIEEIGNDSKHLFKLTNNIMGKTKETILPSIDDLSKFGFFRRGRTSAFLNTSGTVDSVNDLFTISLIIEIKVSKSLHGNLQSAYRSCHLTETPYSVFITI